MATPLTEQARLERMRNLVRNNAPSHADAVMNANGFVFIVDATVIKLPVVQSSPDSDILEWDATKPYFVEPSDWFYRRSFSEQTWIRAATMEDAVREARQQYAIRHSGLRG